MIGSSLTEARRSAVALTFPIAQCR